MQTTSNQQIATEAIGSIFIADNDKPDIQARYINFGNGLKGRITSFGSKVINVKTIGKRTLSKDCIGRIITMNDVDFTI